ncbi:hypothetical protein HID58_055949, partial [Brassica napus]
MPRARLSASNRRHNRRLWPPSTFQTRLKPHSLQIEDPMTPPAMNLVEHEGQMIASPPAIVSPPASGPLAVEEDAGDITVEEEAVDEHEIDEEAPDDDSYKGPTFVRSLVTQMPVDKIPPPALKEDGSLRFPWAARMNQSSRNLFRATEPTFRLDGTPQVTIPSK